MGTLYIVGTPIGNLEDITLRALRVLKEVGLIAAEDTRVTRKLLDRHGIRTPLTSYHEHNKLSKLPSLLEALADKDVALVCDAGMPGINDPGYELVREASKAGIAVVVIPGPSAVTAAIAVSGVAVDQWTYLGFLPRKSSERRRLLESFAGDARALVAFETPHRLKSALEDIRDALGDRRIAVCRELTKLHEEVFRGTASEAIERFAEPKGEFTLVIEGGATAPIENPSGEDARELLARLRKQGIGAREAVAAAVEQSGLSRREVYRIWLEMERKA
ncbi:MAG: 16S rRNA (cytidine(1402)-2'-O)-methyltransferase [Chloroflexi bacterium]|nr:16S rRNA (cytidine(1402)-2'-O)-methyltransferase [Chloroflexota bacterium]